MEQGWISIHRKVKDNFLFKQRRSFSNFEAWIDILLNVNHKEQKVLIKGSLFTVNRGQSINSKMTWSKRWGWNRSKTNRFLTLLQNEGMIDLKSNNITTILTVCKYETYQDGRTSDEHQTNIKRTSDEHQTNTNNNDNNINNDNNDNNKKENIVKEKPKRFLFSKELINLGGKESLVEDWLMVRKNKRATNTETALNNFISQVKKSGMDLNYVLTLCVSNSWSSFNHKWNYEGKTTNAQVIKKQQRRNIVF